MGDERAGGKLDFVDSLARLFRGERETRAPEPQARKADALEILHADFESALQALNQKIEERVREAAPAEALAAAGAKTAEERAAETQQRLKAAHLAISEDIVKMHARLGTGLGSAELDALAEFSKEVEAVWAEGADSHSMLPRASYAILKRLQAETGELAVDRLVQLLQRQKLEWPDPTRYRATASPEEIERSRRRRLSEVREAFVASGIERTAERMFGIVRGWGSYYPDRGSPLWEESVLEGVGAGIRTRLMKDFVDFLRRDPEKLLAQAHDAIGKEIAALQQVVQGGIGSIEDANRAVASSLRVLDVVVPEIAWKQLTEALPLARGQWPS